MEALKNMAKMSTDLFVKFNEQVVDHMKEWKIDDRFTNEILGATHHVRDKSDFYFELSSFWNIVEPELVKDDLKNEIVMDALYELNKSSRLIYGRKATENTSKTVEFFSSIESMSDDLGRRFCELGLSSEELVKEKFEIVSGYGKSFSELAAGEFSADYSEFDNLWKIFQLEFLE